jgi:hypothetical protein
MNKAKLADARYYRMRLFPVAWRMTTDGVWLPPIDDDWILNDVDGASVAYLQNIRTHHVAQLGTDRIHHFDREPHRDWDGLKHGLLEVRAQLVLSGCNIHYLPLPNFRPRSH